MDKIYELLVNQAQILAKVPSYGEQVHVEGPVLTYPPVRQIYLQLPLNLESSIAGSTIVEAVWTAYTIPLGDEYIQHALEVQSAMLAAFGGQMHSCVRAVRMSIEAREIDAPALPVSIMTTETIEEV